MIADVRRMRGVACEVDVMYTGAHVERIRGLLAVHDLFRAHGARIAQARELIVARRLPSLATWRERRVRQDTP